MRTVTFSDPEVVKTLNKNFVCAWINKAPFKRFRDGLYKGQPPQELPNRTAPDNVTSVFASWDGTVVHALSGSMDVREFRWNADFARDLAEQCYEGVGLRAYAGAIYTDAHKRAGDQARDDLARRTHIRLSKEMKNIKDWYPTLFDMLFAQKRICD
jgi:hypothetical protein